MILVNYKDSKTNENTALGGENNRNSRRTVEEDADDQLTFLSQEKDGSLRAYHQSDVISSCRCFFCFPHGFNDIN